MRKKSPNGPKSILSKGSHNKRDITLLIGHQTAKKINYNSLFYEFSKLSQSPENLFLFAVCAGWIKYDWNEWEAAWSNGNKEFCQLQKLKLQQIIWEQPVVKLFKRFLFAVDSVTYDDTEGKTVKVPIDKKKCQSCR